MLIHHLQTLNIISRCTFCFSFHIPTDKISNCELLLEHLHAATICHFCNSPEMKIEIKLSITLSFPSYFCLFFFFLYILLFLFDFHYSVGKLSRFSNSQGESVNTTSDFLYMPVNTNQQRNLLSSRLGFFVCLFWKGLLYSKELKEQYYYCLNPTSFRQVHETLNRAA